MNMKILDSPIFMVFVIVFSPYMSRLCITACICSKTRRLMSTTLSGSRGSNRGKVRRGVVIVGVFVKKQGLRLELGDE